MKSKFVQLLVLILLVTLLLLSEVYSQNVKSRPIIISFSSKPARQITQAETYILEVFWRNNDKTNSYEGYIVFTLHKSPNLQIRSGDLNFRFEGNIIYPKLTANSLLYLLPEQIFNADETGTIKAEVTYNKIGRFRWSIDTALAN